MDRRAVGGVGPGHGAPPCHFSPANSTEFNPPADIITSFPPSCCRQLESPYQPTHQFTNTELLAITPEAIVSWMRFKLYDKADPGPDDEPVLGSLLTLNGYKVGLSYFMPSKEPWDAGTGRGNPTRSAEVNDFLREVKDLNLPPSKKRKSDVNGGLAVPTAGTPGGGRGSKRAKRSEGPKQRHELAGVADRATYLSILTTTGAEVIPATSDEDLRTTCVCGDPECRKLTLAYKSLSDARGQMLTMPILAGSRVTEDKLGLRAVKSFKLERAVLALGLVEPPEEGAGVDLEVLKQFASVDNREPTVRKSRKANSAAAGGEKSGGGGAEEMAIDPHVKAEEGADGAEEQPPQEPVETFAEDGTALKAEEAANDASEPSKSASNRNKGREFKSLAMHHFHPRVVKFFVSGGQRATFQDVITEQFVKDCGLDRRGYSDADNSVSSWIGLIMSSGACSDSFAASVRRRHSSATASSPR